jgi:mycofactocin glycosyltransferase
VAASPRTRPDVDVVVPFAGSARDLARVLARLATLDVGEHDSLTLADNRTSALPLAAPAGVRVVRATAERTSYHARNVGARAGTAPWLLFLDGDVEPPPDILDRYFEAEPADRTAVLAGAVVDEAPAGGASPLAVRYAHLKASMSQEITLGHGRWAFAQTANCAVRREAFDAVGGFAEGVRSGGDADLCFRLAAAGWELERRAQAAVVHRNRTSVPAMLAQRMRHGAGAAWLARRHPGAFPRRRWPGLAWWSVRRMTAGLVALARGDREAAVLGLLDGPAVWAFELGRLVPNRPLRRAPQR